MQDISLPFQNLNMKPILTSLFTSLYLESDRGSRVNIEMYIVVKSLQCAPDK